METIELKLQNDEKVLINNILLENCMSLADLLGEQKNQASYTKLISIIQVTIGCQQSFFSACLEEKLEIPKSMAEFIKPLLESALENLNSIKESLIKKGDKNGFAVASTVEILGNIIKKLPNPSLIIAP